MRTLALAVCCALFLSACGDGEGAFKSERERIYERCKQKGGVIVTNTRPMHGEPGFVCVKPL